MIDSLSAPVTALAAAIRRREVSPLELVTEHIRRIEAVNPAVNALVRDRFERALDEARAAEERVTREAPGDLPPLLGVPCTIKEFLAVEGLHHTAGLLSRRDVVASSDATVVQRMKRAGAIILGVTNVPEGGMWMETHNKLYGRTKNPWRLSRTPGGSSGGEAALIAAGASPIGIGSDIAGSVRIPAAFCGIVAHKPTGRMVPNTGHWGPDASGTAPFLTSGPMGRSIADLSLVLDVIAGPDGIDALTVPWDLPAWNQADLSDVVVYPLETNGVMPVRESMRAQVRRAADVLERRGARRATLDAPLLQQAFAIWATAMSDGAGSQSFAELLGDGPPMRLGAELARTLVGRSRLTLPALALALLEKASALLPPRLAANVPKPAALQAELEHAIGPNGVILHPPYTRTAPRHGAALLTPFHFLCTGVFNLVEFPVTQVPTGFDDIGLPLGVQVAGRRGNDRLTLMVAAVLEEELGGVIFAPPPQSRSWPWSRRR
ncbi:MAG TPA: amidase [Kofleriaceae bacterium]|nr:amidase [Kofleriaceae bacterium]